VLCRKYAAGAFDAGLLGGALLGFSTSLESVFPSILGLAQHAVSVTKVGFASNSTVASVAHTIGQLLYMQLYATFPLAVHR
jgi:hypothetical protein